MITKIFLEEIRIFRFNCDRIYFKSYIKFNLIMCRVAGGLKMTKDTIFTKILLHFTCKITFYILNKKREVVFFKKVTFG